MRKHFSITVLVLLPALMLSGCKILMLEQGIFCLLYTSENTLGLDGAIYAQNCSVLACHIRKTSLAVLVKVFIHLNLLAVFALVACTEMRTARTRFTGINLTLRRKTTLSLVRPVSRKEKRTTRFACIKIALFVV